MKVFLGLLVLLSVGSYACETKTVYLPDGKVQVCQVCKDVVVCY